MALAPEFLKKGDTIYLLSTARKISLIDLQDAIGMFESWGLKVIVGKTIGTEENQFAGSDALRLSDFQTAIDHPEVKAVFCARGGYGTVRMIDKIDFTEFTKKPKWIVGFSDVTFLHSLINNQLNIQTLHAAMPSTYKTTEPEAIAEIGKVLFGETINYNIAPHPMNIAGLIEGEVIGGNLSILYSITGTKSGFDTTDKVLFIEDLDEYLYHIDRMMINLKRSGKLNHLKGLIVGGFSDMHDNEVPFGKNAYEIIMEHVSEFDYPVCFDFPAGHISNNRPIVFGKKISLKVERTAI
jgi:muramoyltetrapeptide carboxypeptidase